MYTFVLLPESVKCPPDTYCSDVQVSRSSDGNISQSSHLRGSDPQYHSEGLPKDWSFVMRCPATEIAKECFYVVIIAADFENELTLSVHT